MIELIKRVEQWSEDRGFFEEGSGVTFEAQFLKLYEEFGELCGSIVKGKDVKDDIGDNMVVLINLAKIKGFSLADILVKRGLVSFYPYSFADVSMYALELSVNRYPRIFEYGNESSFSDSYLMLSSLAIEMDTTLKECLQIAYDEIKDRKGKMINGAFIKEGDL